MANQDANDNKRIINITMNIELKNSESDKEYQELVKNITKDAIDAVLTTTKSINNADNKELAINNKDNINGTFDTFENVDSGTKKETPKKGGNATNIETDKGAETEIMKQVKLSLELKKPKRNNNDNSSATATSSVTGLLCSPSISGTYVKNVTGAKTAHDLKKSTGTTNEDKDKPIIETEAMTRIRLSLELKNKSKLKKNNIRAPTSKSTTSTIIIPTSSTRTCQIVEGAGNTKSPGKGIKRKIEEVGTDKTLKIHITTDTEGMKKIKLTNSRQNEYYPNTPTSTITNEQMDFDDANVSDHQKKQASPASGTGSKKSTTQDTEKVAVETEAMKMIRLRLEAKKNKNNNKKTATSTITSASSSTGTLSGAIKDKIQVKSPKPVKRQIVTEDKPTEEMKRMQALIKQKIKSPKSKTSNAASSSTTSRITNTKTKISNENKSLKSIPKSLILNEMTEENQAVSKKAAAAVVNSEITNEDTGENDNNKYESASKLLSMSSYQSAMNVDVEKSDDNVAAKFTGRVTRSKTWERRVWKK